MGGVDAAGVSVGPLELTVLAWWRLLLQIFRDAEDGDDELQGHTRQQHIDDQGDGAGAHRHDAPEKALPKAAAHPGQCAQQCPDQIQAVKSSHDAGRDELLEGEVEEQTAHRSKLRPEAGEK